MDRYSILDSSSAQPAPPAIAAKGDTVDLIAAPPVPLREPLRFPGDDGGKSLTEMALRDLESALQLLVERAQYITGASGAAIALRHGTDMICRASAGPSAPELGAHLQVNSGLSGESVRTRQILRCDDAETDPRVNRESCRALGIASVVVMPLQRDQEVNGVFELFSGRPYAFEERDIAALQRLAEMIQTALEHADAGQRAEKEVATKVQERVASDPSARPVEAAKPLTGAEEDEPGFALGAAVQAPSALEPPAPPVSVETAKIRKCERCGFPVSEGRVLCLDCESANPGAASAASPRDSNSSPEFLAQLAEHRNQSWLQSHKLAIVFVAIAVVAVVVWLRFF